MRDIVAMLTLIKGKRPLEVVAVVAVVVVTLVSSTYSLNQWTTVTYTFAQRCLTTFALPATAFESGAEGISLVSVAVV